MFVKGDIVSFLRRRNRKEGWSGRNVARIFHGMASAQFPKEDWCRDPAWGCHKYELIYIRREEELCHTNF